MRKLQIWLFLPATFLVLTVTFQNCSGGFAYNPASGQFASSANDSVGEFGLRIYSTDNRVVSQNTPFVPGRSYEARAVGANASSALLIWTVDESSTADCELNSQGVLTKRELKCSTEGTVSLKLQAYWPDETVSSVVHVHTVSTNPVAPPPSTEDENTVAFRILAGTSGGAWNTAQSSVVLFVGQNFRVYNDDNVNHRIATSGSPFPTQNDQIVPNTYKDFAVVSPIAANSASIYDANFGTGARIYLTAIDGDAVYAGPGGANVQSCASCHGGISSSNKRGSSFQAIKAAIAQNTGGMGNITLSDVNIRAIEYALNH